MSSSMLDYIDIVWLKRGHEPDWDAMHAKVPTLPVHLHVYEYREDLKTLVAHELLTGGMGDGGQTTCGMETWPAGHEDQDTWYSDHDRDDVQLCHPCGTEADRPDPHTAYALSSGPTVHELDADDLERLHGYIDSLRESLQVQEGVEMRDVAYFDVGEHRVFLAYDGDWNLTDLDEMGALDIGGFYQ